MNGGAGAELPLGVSFVLGRWEELTDPRARWWTRGVGLGVRLRIDELLELSAAHQDGMIYASSVDRLRDQARDSLGRANSFLDERFGPLREMINSALSKTKKADRSGLGTLWPGSTAHSALEAGLAFLASANYFAAVIDELGTRAEDADDLAKLEALDEVIELLDGELIADGHSRRWRADFYERVARKARAGGELRDGILEELDEKREMGNFEVLVGLDAYSEPDDVEAQIPYLEEDALHRLVTEWEQQPEAGQLDFEFGGLKFGTKAADRYAAAETAAEYFETTRALWSLQGGGLKLRPELIVYDTTYKTVAVIAPEDSLDLRPENLAAVRIRSGEGAPNTPSQLTDGMLQLAQARMSPMGAALADLWGVAEVCFSGVAVGSRDQAGGVIAGIAQFLYLGDRLEWLGERFEALGVAPVRSAEQSHADWALERVDEDDGALAEFLRKADPLVWARAVQVGRWNSDKHLEHDLRDVRKRVEAVSARAYLIRNFYIHAGKAERSAALAVTLPVFAELLRLSLGFALKADMEPVVSARLAMLRARQLAFQFETQATTDLGAVAETTHSDWGAED
jgi:hypothetical protein